MLRGALRGVLQTWGNHITMLDEWGVGWGVVAPGITVKNIK